MSQKVLVTGATGFLGRAVAQCFESSGWSVTGIGFSRASPPKTIKLDLTASEGVEKVIDDVKPSVIVHCAADRSPDSVSANPEAAKLINVTATSTLAQLASQRSILLIYISTDYVFPGVPGEAPYYASATPRPTNLYGETKLSGENVALEAATKNGAEGSVVVLRVPVLYGNVEPSGNNKESAINCLLDTVWAAQEPRANIKMDDWALRYPTNTEDVGRVCKEIAAKYTTDENKKTLPKILHFTSEDQYTKYQICELIAEIMGLPLQNREGGGVIANKAGNRPGAMVQRPYDTHLSTEELRRLGIDVSTQDFRAWWRWHCRAVRR